MYTYTNNFNRNLEISVSIQLYLPLFILNKLFPNEVSHTEILKNSCYSGQEAT